MLTKNFEKFGAKYGIKRGGYIQELIDYNKPRKGEKEVIKAAKAGTACGILGPAKFNDCQKGDIIASVVQKEL